MNVSFSDGFVVFVESDKPGEWWLAKSWQKREFMRVMKFGTMKSMGGCVQPDEITEPFKEGQYKYRFIIQNEWGPVTLENVTTGKKRQINYHHLFPETDDGVNKSNLIKLSHIKGI